MWFSTLAMVALAFGRLSGVRHMIAVPEAFFIISPFWLLLRIFPARRSRPWMSCCSPPTATSATARPVWEGSSPSIVPCRWRWPPVSRPAFARGAPALRHCHPSGGPLGAVLCRLCRGRTDHFAWALVILWFAWKYCGSKVHADALLFAIFSMIAALGTGEHYIIDLVLSVPFLAAILALIDREWKRAGCLFLALLLWAVSLRQGWALPLAPPAVWLLSGLTVAMPCWRPGRADERIRPPVPAAL